MDATARTGRVTGRAALALSVSFIALTAPIGVADRPLPAGDEAREAAVAKSMLQSGDWSKSVLGGEVLYEKPPFFYMAVAMAARALGGLSPLAARLPSVLFAALALAATAWAGARLFRPRTGLAAMLVLATSYLFFVNAHNCLIDVPLTGFVALGLAAFIARERREAPRWDGLFGFAAAGSLLTKGLVGPLLLVLLTAPFWWLSSSRRKLSQSVSAFAPLWPLAALALWMGVTWRALGPHGLHEVLWIQHVGRFLGFAEPSYEHHRASFFFYLPLLPGLVFPWALLAAGGLVSACSARAGRRALRPLAAGFLLVLVFFSLSGTKRTVYLLPLVPAAALLAAGYLEVAATKPARGERLLLAAQGVLALAAVVGAVVLATGRPRGDPDAEFFREVERRLPRDGVLVAYNVNLDLLGKAILEMDRPPREEYSVERAATACSGARVYVLSEVEHLLPPFVAPLREAIEPVYAGNAGDKLLALYRCRPTPGER